jgi:hypothetical protein
MSPFASRNSQHRFFAFEMRNRLSHFAARLKNQLPPGDSSAAISDLNLLFAVPPHDQRFTWDLNASMIWSEFNYISKYNPHAKSDRGRKK